MFIRHKSFFLLPVYPKQETAKDGMAGLQSGNKIWEDWLRTSLNAMFNLRYCMTLKFEWTKSRSQKPLKRQQNLGRSLRTYLNTKDNLHVIYCKNSKWPRTGKVKVSRAPDNFWVQRVFTHWFLTQCWFSNFQLYFHPHIFFRNADYCFGASCAFSFIPLWCAIAIDLVVLYSKHVYV